MLAEVTRSERWTRADEAWFKRPREYPIERRQPVFCWLWANHHEVTELRRKMFLGWQQIADIMRNDGVVGSRGAPPNANAVRRVFGRVCLEIAAWEVRKAAAEQMTWPQREEYLRREDAKRVRRAGQAGQFGSAKGSRNQS
jgi:hypothetical protein